MEKMFGYVPGQDMTPPIHSLVEEMQERDRLNETGTDQIFDNIFAE